MADIYASTTATGANDGSSWVDAFTSIATACAALAPGDDLYTNAPEASPFREQALIDGVDNITVYPASGPDAVTWIRGGRVHTWTDEGEGVFSLLLAEPVFVAYDFKRDDVVGTVTGIDLSIDVPSKMIAKRGLSPSDLRAWYGFLREISSTTTPGEGEWSYSGGSVYINPPDSPDLADVNSLAETCPGGYAMRLNSLTGGDVKAGLRTVLTANQYAVECLGVSDTIVEGVIGIACGDHCIGMAAGSTTGNRIRNCIALGHQHASGVANPFVHFTQSSRDDADFIGDRLTFIAYPHLDTLGRPLDNEFTPRLGYSHTPGDPVVQGGINWRSPLMLDYSDALEVKHGITITGQGLLAVAAHIPTPSDRLDPSTWHNQVSDALAWGRAAVPGFGLRTQVDFLDRSTFTKAGVGEILNSNIGTLLVSVKGGQWKTGNFGRTSVPAFFHNFNDIDALVLDEVDLTLQCSLVESALLNIGTNSDVFVLKSTRWINEGSSEAICGVSNPGFWSNGFTGIVSDGANEFDVGITTTLRHSNPAVPPRDQAYWQANIDGGATDTFNADIEFDDPLAAVGGGGLDVSELKPGMLDANGNLKDGLVNSAYTGGDGSASQLRPGAVSGDQLKPGWLEGDEQAPGILS